MLCFVRFAEKQRYMWWLKKIIPFITSFIIMFGIYLEDYTKLTKIIITSISTDLIVCQLLI